jgi:hypothetical protein
MGHRPERSSVLQGIHDLSIMLGYEASRDLEQKAIQGVRTRPFCFLAHTRLGAAPDKTNHSNRRLARLEVQWSNLGSHSRPYCVLDWA